MDGAEAGRRAVPHNLPGTTPRGTLTAMPEVAAAR